MLTAAGGRLPVSVPGLRLGALRLDDQVSNPSVSDPPSGRRGLERADLWDAAAVVGIGCLVAAAVIVGRRWQLANVSEILAGVPPLQGKWLPRWTSGGFFAVAVALLVVVLGPPVARRIRGWALPWVTWVAAAGWLVAVAAIDPWQTAFADRLTTRYDYLAALPIVDDWSDLLGGFTQRIPIDAAQAWPTHVAGHPPGVLAPFVALDRLGLEGPGPAAVFLVLVGASAAAGLVVAANALAGRDAGRRLAPFAALMPGAIWIAVSGDALIMATTTWAVALVAVASGSGPGSRASTAWGLGGGLLLGVGLYLSYGMVLMLGVTAAVLLTKGTWRAFLAVAAGVLVVVTAVTVAGFSWWEGYHLVVERYYQGVAGERRYAYWVWANVAAFALAVGPAAVVGVRRSFAGLRQSVGLGELRSATWWRDPQNTVAIVVAAAIGALLIATLGGLSKGEVERIWLPFAPWLLLAAVAIPEHRVRWWLALQAALVLAVQHLVLTPW